MVQISMPSRHTGTVRMVSSADGWKPTLTEFQLTPEQVERYRNGEKIEDILKGDKPVGLTKERYLGLKDQGTADMKIAKEFGFKHIGELTQWKKENFSPEEIEQLRINTLQAKRAGTVNKSILSHSKDDEGKTTKDEFSPEIEEINNEIERLKREVIHAHKLVTEKDERLNDSLQEHLRKDELIAKLQKQLESSVELYETATLDKENIQKENVSLENNIHALIRQRDLLQERCDRYQSEFLDLEEEVNGLRRFAMVKLKKDVFPA